jgi:isopentenyl phosphate kinase
MDELILIKLGGSIITDKSKPFTEDLATIRRLAKEIHEAHSEKKFKIIVGHGGGSFPHTPAHEFQTHKGIINEKSYEGIAKVQDAAATLNRIIVRELIAAGENAVSINLSSNCIAEGGEIKEMFLEPVKKLLDFNMIPVPYGDVCLDLKNGCCILSTEKILSYVVKVFQQFGKKYEISRIIICTDVDGVFDRDPKEDKNSKLIRVITEDELKKINLSSSSGIDVTGKMKHKIETMIKLAKSNIEIEIINAKKPDILKRALFGERGLGTIIKYN